MSDTIHPTNEETATMIRERMTKAGFINPNRPLINREKLEGQCSTLTLRKTDHVNYDALLSKLDLATLNAIDTKYLGKVPQQNQLDESDGDDDNTINADETTGLLNKNDKLRRFSLAVDQYPTYKRPQGKFPTTTFLRSLFLLSLGIFFSTAGIYRYLYDESEVYPIFILAALTLIPSVYQLVSIICASMNCCDMTYCDIPNE